MAARLQPIDEKMTWTRAHARHLLNRAGFGMPVHVLDQLESMGPARAVALMVDYDKYPDPFAEPDWLTSPADVEEARSGMRGLSQEEREMANRALQRQAREEVERLKSWWLGRMAKTTRPLQEKMALFWHGHFAVSAEKVKSAYFNYQLNKVFRDYATGNFRDLVFEVGKSPAMLEYLDNRQNRKGQPNENWSRELMELFTIGIGNYTEEDIKEAARAFSGYTHRGGEFTFVSAQHDYGEKTFMGRTGTFDGADIIRIIHEQPGTARFISRKIWEYLVYDDPDEALVEELAAVLRENDYELKPLLRAIFASREFYSDRAMDGLVKSPAQYLVALQDHLGMEEQPRAALLTLAMRSLGQDLFYPPNVKGWEGNRAWINTNTALTRYNIPVYLAMGRRPNLETDPRLDSMVGDGDAMMMAPVMQQQGGVPSTARREQAREKIAAARRKQAETKAKAAAKRNPVSRAMVKFEPLFDPWINKPVSDAVVGLVDRLMGRPLDRQQYTVLATALANQSLTEPLTAETVRANGPAFLQLALSMAEYQVC